MGGRGQPRIRTSCESAVPTRSAIQPHQTPAGTQRELGSPPHLRQKHRAPLALGLVLGLLGQGRWGQKTPKFQHLSR